MVFPKGAVPAHDLSCIIWKDGIFFPKTWPFSGNTWKHDASPSEKDRKPDI